jgi:hypothetical protein
MSKRTLRRHHRERMRQHCARILKFHWSEAIASGCVTYEDIERWARFRGDNFSICSCWMCGNPRRLRGGNGSTLTVQELRIHGILEENDVD